ncbi:MAG: DUF4179 domain-containing protein [Clostridiales bacterium]|nr:DUF4179 domain-containing protein [Clostridiales bacterium]
MIEQREKERIKKAYETSLSGLQEDPWLAQRVLNEGKEKKRMKKSISLLLAFALTLMVGTAAYAATQWGIYDFLGSMLGKQPAGADQVMQSNLHQETVNGVEITVKEAGYDGKTLFLLYSYRILDAKEPIGIQKNGAYLITEADENLLYEKNVGWWIDQLWINGKAVDMPGNSGSSIWGSDVPGEIIHAEYWRLDNEELALEGEIEISLPIGERQNLNDYRKVDHPEKYGEDGELLPPEKGLITFRFDAKDTLSKVRTFAANEEKTMPEITAKVTEASFTPLMTYITLELQGNEAALASYKAKNGEGYYDENGTLLFPYTDMDVFSGYIDSLTLVDRKGTILFEEARGCNGLSNTWAEFIFPHLENIPDALYLAPAPNGTADMNQAIRVK